MTIARVFGQMFVFRTCAHSPQPYARSSTFLEFLSIHSFRSGELTEIPFYVGTPWFFSETTPLPNVPAADRLDSFETPFARNVTTKTRHAYATDYGRLKRVNFVRGTNRTVSRNANLGRRSRRLQPGRGRSNTRHFAAGGRSSGFVAPKSDGTRN